MQIVKLALIALRLLARRMIDAFVQLIEQLEFFYRAHPDVWMTFKLTVKPAGRGFHRPDTDRLRQGHERGPAAA